MSKKKHRPAEATFEAKKYQIFGSREIWLREQRERDKKYRESQMIHVKGHNRKLASGKVIYIKPYYRKRGKSK